MIEKQRLIVGFTGQLACGKGTAAKYLKDQYMATTFRFSTMLRDVLDRLYLPHERDSLIDLSVWLRQRFGQDLMARVMAKDAQDSTAEIVVVEGIRRDEDIVHLKKLNNFTLISVEADARLRYERLLKRGENPDDTSKTWEQFQADHQKETEISIPAVMAQADRIVNNDGSLEDLYSQLDDLLKVLRGS